MNTAAKTATNQKTRWIRDKPETDHCARTDKELLWITAIVESAVACAKLMIFTNKLPRTQPTIVYTAATIENFIEIPRPRNPMKNPITSPTPADAKP